MLLLFSFIATSCIEKPVTLSTVQMKQVDTLTRNVIVPLRLELDSICNLRFDAEVERAVDSIVIVRFGEINKRLGQ